jgi:hypothetical protein
MKQQEQLQEQEQGWVVMLVKTTMMDLQLPMKAGLQDLLIDHSLLYWEGG